MSDAFAGGTGRTLRAFRDDVTTLVEYVAPSVVTVRLSTASLQGGVGSGWFIEPGVVVTNHHVIAGESPVVTLRLRGGRSVPAEIVGSDPRTDLAVLCCDTDNVRPLPLQADLTRLGELAFAFGSPLGDYTESVTMGIVSGVGRRMPVASGHSIENLVQTDAEINPGNSGGPLVDLDGQVLGVNVSIRADGRGMGFAVPATTVASIVPELLEHGEILRPRLGVAIEVIDSLDPDARRESFRVSSAPAGHALRRGDVVLSISGVPIVNRASLFDVMRRPLLERDTEVEIERGGEVERVTIRPER